MSWADVIVVSVTDPMEMARAIVGHDRATASHAVAAAETPAADPPVVMVLASATPEEMPESLRLTLAAAIAQFTLDAGGQVGQAVGGGLPSPQRAAPHSVVMAPLRPVTDALKAVAGNRVEHSVARDGLFQAEHVVLLPHPLAAAWAEEYLASGEAFSRDLPRLGLPNDGSADGLSTAPVNESEPMGLAQLLWSLHALVPDLRIHPWPHDL